MLLKKLLRRTARSELSMISISDLRNFKRRVLVIGQTPPPYGGQAIMIQSLVEARFERIEVHHVRMSFSGYHSRSGRFTSRKLLVLFAVIAQSIYYKFRYRTDTLYYPPSGPNLIPIIRDIIILSFLRLFFKKKIYHFHAAGLSDYLKQHGRVFSWIAKWAYGRPDLAIENSSLNPKDGEYISAKRILIIPNGLDDHANMKLIAHHAYDSPDVAIQLSRLNPADGPYFHPRRVFNIPNGIEDNYSSNAERTRNRGKEKVRLLYVGVLSETKGVLVLLEAVKLLKASGLDFCLDLMGEYATRELEIRVRDLRKAYELEDIVSSIGVKTGSEKEQVFLRSDIFCFPTFFESESFGNVLLEAMMFELPIVATAWRAIPEIVDDGINGFVVPIRNPGVLAEKIALLISDGELRRRMGAEGRKKFVKEYSLSKHLERMEAALSSVLDLPDTAETSQVEEQQIEDHMRTGGKPT